MVLLLSARLLAQSADPEDAFVFERLSLEDGLSNAEVTDILQDSRGLMWFATMNGLNRYDGYGFKVYKNDPDDSRSLPMNIVRSLLEDRRGVLWVGLATTLAVFDRRTERFRPIPLENGRPYIVETLYEDQAGRLWIATWDAGILRFDARRGQCVPVRFKPRAPAREAPNAVLSIHEAADRIWLGNYRRHAALGCLDPLTGDYTEYRPPELQNNQPNASFIVSSITPGPAGKLWLSTNHGLYAFDPHERIFSRPAFAATLPQGLDVHEALIDRAGRLWLALSLSGLACFDDKPTDARYYRHDPRDARSLSDDIIMSMLEDRSGVLWFATNNGISRVIPHKPAFRKMESVTGQMKRPGDKGITCLYEDDDGRLWIGTEFNGLSRVDIQTGGIIQNFTYDPSIPTSLSSELVWALAEDRRGDLWVGTNGGGLNRFNREDGTFRRYLNDPADARSITSDYVTSLVVDHQGRLWLGTFNGLDVFDPQTETFQHFLQDTINSANGPIHNVIQALHEDAKGYLWIATDEGLSVLDPSRKHFTHFQHQRDNSQSLSNNRLISLLSDGKGFLWVGTDAGLTRIHWPQGGAPSPDKAVFRRYGEKDGMANQYIVGMLEDEQGRLWLSSQKGLSCFKNPRHEASSPPQFRNYSLKDGLQGYTFLRRANYKSRSGALYFGGSEGYNVFYPDDMQDNPYRPPVVITAFEKFDTDHPDRGAIAVAGITDQDTIILTHKNNIFSLEFAAMDFHDPEHNNFAYRLEGFNENWVRLGNRRQVTFTNLDPGRYVFRVKASNADGVWNEEGARLVIIVRPPWWKTWWAYTLYAVLLIGALYGLFRYERNRQQLRHERDLQQLLARQKQREAEQLQEVDELKSRFFANISHEFRTPLTLILGPLNDLIAGKSDGEPVKLYRLMRRNAQRLLVLINQLLDLARLEGNKMRWEPAWADLLPLARRVTNSFQSLARQQEIDLQLKSDVATSYLWFDADKVEKILTNLLSNAFRFTPTGGFVHVSLGEWTQADGRHWVRLGVHDSGTGIEKTDLPHIFDRFYQASKAWKAHQEGSGIGLALTKELVELHQGRIEVTSRVGEGSSFTILLPVGEAPEQISSPEADPPQTAYSALAAAALTTDPAASKAGATGKTAAAEIILLVEDDVDMRAYLYNQLRSRYQVLRAEDGQAGIERAREVIPDLVISDVMMPGMDGYELCRRLKSDDRTSHVPVILLTAASSRDNKLAGLELGADDYLTKPFDGEELSMRINNLIVQRRRLREHYSQALLQPEAIPNEPSREELFLQKLVTAVEAHIAEETLDAQILGRAVAMSRAQLYRKLQALTGQSVGEFILSIRLRRAADLLAQSADSIAEIAFSVGFQDPSYFSRCFRQQFGATPSEYRKRGGKQ